MNARPVAGDAPPYYFTYIDQVEGNDCLNTMTAQFEESLALFGGISEEKSLHRYSPEKWSIRQVLSQINHCLAGLRYARSPEVRSRLRYSAAQL